MTDRLRTVTWDVPVDTETMFAPDKTISASGGIKFRPPLFGIQVKKLHPKAIIPTRGTQYSAGYDLYACLDAPMIFPGPVHHATLIPTGIAFDMTHLSASMVGLVFPRSGLGHKYGMVLGNGVGVIDVDYQGEVFVSMIKRSPGEFIINPGERIAQIVFMPLMVGPIIEVDEFTSVTKRGAGGFGSTGR